jgi:hypothetical protein
MHPSRRVRVARTLVLVAFAASGPLPARAAPEVHEVQVAALNPADPDSTFNYNALLPLRLCSVSESEAARGSRTYGRNCAGWRMFWTDAGTKMRQVRAGPRSGPVEGVTP